MELTSLFSISLPITCSFRLNLISIPPNTEEILKNQLIYGRNYISSKSITAPSIVYCVRCSNKLNFYCSFLPIIKAIALQEKLNLNRMTIFVGVGNYSNVIVISTTNYMFGTAIWDKLHERIFENFEISRVKRWQFQNFKKSQG